MEIVTEDGAANYPEPFDFGTALIGLKAGKRLQRTGWNGKGMFIYLCNPETEYEFKGGAMDGEKYGRLPYLYMKTADDKLVPWLASQTDILAEDWQEYKE